jgi:hypothetical protein
MRRFGFDAFVGNPPWILYAGKGKQPIDSSEEALLKELFGRAARTLSSHGLFAAQAGRLSRPRGRVGLVMPTSMADASRYCDVRAGHSAWCVVDSGLPDFGEKAFVGVFQPCMALLSERRALPIAEKDADGAPWVLAQSGLDPRVRSLLAKLDQRPKLPAELFGERGYRSSKADEGAFIKAAGPRPPYQVPLFEGTSVREFQILGPTAFADGSRLPEVLRVDKWSSVALFIRQTARYPIATRSSGGAFRNSILAGFERPPWSAELLLGYLNSTPVRWYHFHKQRDAQQGMPQVKIGHLRALPAPDGATVTAIATLARKLSHQNVGITDSERAELDALVAAGLGLDESELAHVRQWGAANPPPVGRDVGARSAEPPVEERGPGVRRALHGDEHQAPKRTKAGS